MYRSIRSIILCLLVIIAASLGEAANCLDLSGKTLKNLKGIKLDQRITCLDVSNNRITSLTSDAIPNCGGLRRIVLNDNPLEIVDVFAFRGCRVLEEISMSGGNLVSLDRNLIEGLPRLTRLDVSRNFLANVALSSGSLTHWNCSDNAVTSVQLEELTSLDVIDLRGNKLKRLENGTFDVIRRSNSSYKGVFLADNYLPCNETGELQELMLDENRNCLGPRSYDGSLADTSAPVEKNCGTRYANSSGVTAGINGLIVFLSAVVWCWFKYVCI